MTSKQIRQEFFDFFEEKKHKIVPSAPIVLKDDPTLMFTNAGMNQFKDLFLGYKTPEYRRIADTQKCLRVSGKHNDLEEVGVDSYHHTMFEMLGNWSIGDYFKVESIDWAWELLTEVYKLDKSRIYATVFGGDKHEGLGKDVEAYDHWTKYLPEDHVLYCGKKDNFWEMGDTGPCGPCSELHFDLRSDEERAKVDGATLVNEDHPLVIEIWNLVFMQFNRKSDGSLEDLPEMHIDTGMGFERLCMVIQNKQSNYDTDVFTPLISLIEKETGFKYEGSYAPEAKKDIAMRVIADHVRAVSFAIADGEMPGNTGAAYVIRRILRRAVRYYYSFLDRKEPLIYKLVPVLSDLFADVFPEVDSQKGFVEKVILEEEKSFLRTLAGGLKRLDNIELEGNTVPGKAAFELYDTYGFPIDLTRLIASEKGWIVDEKGFDQSLQEQKNRGKEDAKRETGDWNLVAEGNDVEFVGYDHDHVKDAEVLKFRTLKKKDKEIYQLVLSKTPFYAEGGGQVGDIGTIEVGGETLKVLNTVKENDLIIHIVDKLPSRPTGHATCNIDVRRRALTENNHSATHLLHSALRHVLGSHVQQKGSLVKDDYLRFDISHFQKMTDEEIHRVEQIVNQKIRENIALDEQRSLPIQDAKDAGAMMLFGEKYGDYVRMITFDPEYSRELCGGCHVDATGQIGYFKITGESAIAAGVRRIEAVTADKAEEYLNGELAELNSIRSLFKNAQHTVRNVQSLQDENSKLKKELEKLQVEIAKGLQGRLEQQIESVGNVNAIFEVVDNIDSKAAKTLAHNLVQSHDKLVVVFGIIDGEKVQLMITTDAETAKTNEIHAGNIVREAAKEIKGGGGGQPFFATAGGKDPSGIDKAMAAVRAALTQ